MNKIIMNYAGADAPCNEKEILSLTSMIIGAVAVSRMIDDESVVKNILASSRQQARLILGGIIKVGQPVAQLPPHKSQRAELPHWAFQNCSLRTRFFFHLEAMTYMRFD